MASFYARRDGVVAPFGGCHIVAGIDFVMPAKAQDYHKRLSAFMTEFVFPAEAEYDWHRIEAGPNDHTLPPIVEELKALAKLRRLWNPFLPTILGPHRADTPPRVGNCVTAGVGNYVTDNP